MFILFNTFISSFSTVNVPKATYKIEILASVTVLNKPLVEWLLQKEINNDRGGGAPNRDLTDPYARVTQVYASGRGVYAGTGHGWHSVEHFHWHSCTTSACWQSDGINLCTG